MMKLVKNPRLPVVCACGARFETIASHGRHRAEEFANTGEFIHKFSPVAPLALYQKTDHDHSITMVAV